jgi:hypothetical protein
MSRSSGGDTTSTSAPRLSIARRASSRESTSSVASTHSSRPRAGCQLGRRRMRSGRPTSVAVRRPSLDTRTATRRRAGPGAAHTSRLANPVVYPSKSSNPPSLPRTEQTGTPAPLSDSMSRNIVRTGRLEFSSQRRRAHTPPFLEQQRQRQKTTSSHQGNLPYMTADVTYRLPECLYDHTD